MNDGCIWRVVDVLISDEPAYRGMKIWQAQFYADPSGNFPVDSVYETTHIGQFNEDDLLGARRKRP